MFYLLTDWHLGVSDDAFSQGGKDDDHDDGHGVGDADDIDHGRDGDTPPCTRTLYLG